MVLLQRHAGASAACETIDNGWGQRNLFFLGRLDGVEHHLFQREQQKLKQNGPADAANKPDPSRSQPDGLRRPFGHAVF